MRSRAVSRPVPDRRGGQSRCDGADERL